MLMKLVYTGVLLGVLVFVHELGHFLVAKACKVKVLKFSIGFGPRLIGFTRGETEYRISWLPLGGYVKMAGELPYEELPPEEAKRGFLAQPAWKRAAIVAAGPVFNLIFPILVYFFVMLGPQQTLSNRIASVEPGLPAAEAKLQAGDRIVAIDGEPVQTFEEITTAIRPRFDQDVALTVERNGQRFVTHLTPAKNVETDPAETSTRGLIGISPSPGQALLGVAPGSAAEKAGLKTFDKVINVDGQPVRDALSLQRAVADAKGELTLQVERSAELPLPGVAARAPEVVTVKVPKQPGEGLAALGAERADLYVLSVAPGSAADKAGLHRGDRLLAINGKDLKSALGVSLVLNRLADAAFTLSWRSGAETRSQQLAQTKMEQKDELGQVTNDLVLGVQLPSPYVNDPELVEKVTRTLGPAAAMGVALKIVPEIIRKTALILGHLFTGRVAFSNVGGPIMLYQIASKSAEQGMQVFLETMAIISINLGMMNLLPIPILDGFHLLAAIWEGIRRRPIPVRAREIANYVGLAMLLVLMVLVMTNDIRR